ncbi:MAG: GntR family transcriptional regulator [Cyanobacteria bacterium SIG32]|nr:GntR family transcriptional regulator [Cyanobacteria bacterium SIG32]
MFFYKYCIIRTKGSVMDIKKNNLKSIKISEISADLPDLKNIKESKAITIAKWLAEWIKSDLKNGNIEINSLLPSKAEFAYALGVSIGTMQNALRHLEDLGFVESKQCIGTLVRDYKKDKTSMRKLTSKREIAVEDIKKYILKSKIKVGQNLPSSRIIAEKINCSPNTARLALENLCSSGILTHKFKNAKETGWILKNLDFEINNSSNETLVLKVQNDLKNYISANLKVGDKMPAHDELSKELKVSIKTIHDSLKILINEGILLARRGRYGTSVIKMPNEMAVEQRRETSIFASAQETAFYYYEKTQNHIKRMLAENYQIGEKLPSIMELSKQMDLSPNTIRKAFHNLAKEGYLAFSRGRYGGTFVIDIPEMEEQAFKWLAVNPKYAEVYKN